MNLNVPEVSVVIPTYNYAHFLKKCLQSLISQTFTNWEALVINNFSDDDTIKVVESFSDGRIRLVNFKNNGIIAASRNKGVEFSRSRLIAFLDSDDIWYPGKLQRCLKEFKSGADLVCHGMRYMVNGKFWKEFTYTTKTRADFYKLFYKNTNIITSATAVRKEYLLKVGGFDENPTIVTAEDYDLWLKLSKENLLFSFVKDILGEYNCHGVSLSRQTLVHLQASLNVVDKYSYRKGRIAPLYFLKIKRAKASLFYGTARNFQREGRRLAALRFFMKALIAFPFLLKPYVGLLLNMLPARFSNFITGDLASKEWMGKTCLTK